MDVAKNAVMSYSNQKLPVQIAVSKGPDFEKVCATPEFFVQRTAVRYFYDDNVGWSGATISAMWHNP